MASQSWSDATIVRAHPCAAGYGKGQSEGERLGGSKGGFTTKIHVWNTILSYFTKGYDGESVMIDATIVRAHPCAAGYGKGQSEEERLGRSKGGFTTKIHI